MSAKGEQIERLRRHGPSRSSLTIRRHVNAPARLTSAAVVITVYYLPIVRRAGQRAYSRWTLAEGGVRCGVVYTGERRCVTTGATPGALIIIIIPPRKRSSPDRSDGRSIDR